MELTWLGRSCFQLTTRHHKRVLFDPHLAHYRRRGLPPFPLPDIICVSHGHLDHFADVPALVRGDSPALVVAIPRLCRALRELIPETQHRLFPLPWDDEIELEGMRFFSFRSPAMQTTLYHLFEEFESSEVLNFLRAVQQLADEILYLPLTSFGIEADGLRLLHFVSESESPEDSVDVGDIGAQLKPDVALVSVSPGQELRSAERAAALGAPLIIPHHYEASGQWPAADLDVFAKELARLAPDAKLQTPDIMQVITL